MIKFINYFALIYIRHVSILDFISGIIHFDYIFMTIDYIFICTYSYREGDSVGCYEAQKWIWTHSIAMIQFGYSVSIIFGKFRKI